LHQGLTALARVRARALVALAVLVTVLLSAGPVLADRAAIASAHPLATAAGYEILQQGGNAFDAAIAVGAALGVVEPYASGLGGGGFFLLHRASDRRDVMVDARETAPERATRSMYIDAEGKPNELNSINGALAAAIPGTPAGLVWLAQHYGRLPLSVSLAPAITLARDGFAVDGRYASAASAREALLKANAQAARIFLADGVAPKEGFKLRQPQLASTLEALATRGRDGFYAGDLAARMVAGVRAGGGIWELDDLATYQVVEREPAHVRYRGALITCAALPSAGGVVLTESLQILGRFPVSSLPPVERDHLIVEALRRSYQDRARYLGDPAFVMPPPRLTTMAYADQRAASISLSKATPSAELDVLYPLIPEGDNTTHFSIVDAEGNRTAATLSVNLPFGAGVVAGDTGVLLNDEMNDFSIAPGVPNAYGLVGNEANAVQPHKRPLSSMTPAFVEDERGILVLGTPGGSRIMSMVLLGILQYVDSATIDVDRIVSAPRFHHQYLPDRIEYEPNGFAPEWIEALTAMGHTMQEGKRRWGNMQAVYVNRASGEAKAANDPRGKAGLLF
jgi:gamma-glutamyltranspeptidase / glutathione hydrolase